MSGTKIQKQDTKKAQHFFAVSRMLLCTLFLLCLTPYISSAVAQTSDAPLEITADETLEWFRNAQQFIARGNAVAEQDGVIIKADTLTADYRDAENSGFEIYRLTATGNVVIQSENHQAHGDKAIYNVDQGVAVMTGDVLRLDTPQQNVTAHEKFEYFVRDQKLTAVGDARVIHGEDMIDADRMAASFTENRNGEQELERLEAHGHVVITTPNETLYGDRGFYLASTNIAEIYGNVRISRGPNVLEGERAEVNLNTNISKMYGSPVEGERVRGVFYPGSNKSDDTDTNEQPSSPHAIAPQDITPFAGPDTESILVPAPNPKTESINVFIRDQDQNFEPESVQPLDLNSESKPSQRPFLTAP